MLRNLKPDIIGSCSSGGARRLTACPESSENSALSLPRGSERTESSCITSCGLTINPHCRIDSRSFTSSGLYD
ncbi:hypothetical protein [Enterobacter phage 02_vB_Eclo_IJM]|nr:hypothetical protein [Enterobacter phage 02_vB_Eclo_IJM]